MISTQKCYSVKQSKPATAALASLSFTLVTYTCNEPRKDFRDLKGSVVAGCAQHSHLSPEV